MSCQTSAYVNLCCSINFSLLVYTPSKYIEEYINWTMKQSTPNYQLLKLLIFRSEIWARPTTVWWDFSELIDDWCGSPCYVSRGCLLKTAFAAVALLCSTWSLTPSCCHEVVHMAEEQASRRMQKNIRKYCSWVHNL